MEAWIIYGLIAAIAFGSNVIIYKLGFENGVNPFLGSALFALGVAIACAAALYFNKSNLSITPKGAGLLILAGLIWAVGFIAITIGIARNYDISKMSIIYSLNVIITVILGILILKEATTTSEMYKTFIGLGLVAAGIIVTSLK